MSMWAGTSQELRIYNRLAELEDKIEDGTLIELPCKVGDTVYYPMFNFDLILLYKVISIKLNSKGLYVVCENKLNKTQMTHRVTLIDKTVFLIKAEAEKKLLELKGVGEEYENN